MKSQKIDWLPLIGLIGALLCAFLAELWRLKGLLLLDLWVPLFSGFALYWWLLERSLIKRWFDLPKALQYASIAALSFIVIGSSSLLINSTHMAFGDFARAAFYPVRWASYFVFGLVLTQSNARTRTLQLWSLFAFATLLSIAGFVQLKIQPDFGEDMTELGWDPHKGRLLSTWFDPNFVGGFLALSLSMMTAAFLKHPRWRLALAPAAAVCLAALVLTLSRSSYLALLAAVGLLALFKARWMIPLGIAGIVMILALSSSTRDRVEDLVDTVQTLVAQEDTYLLPDPSSRERFGKWEEGWELFEDAPLLGQGYNRYEDASFKLGTLKDSTQHDSTGTDSSLLTVLSLTGVLGLLAYLAVFMGFATHAWNTKNWGWLAGMCGLLIHSQFVNSLLYPMLMLAVWAYAVSTSGDSSN